MGNYLESDQLLFLKKILMDHPVQITLFTTKTGTSAQGEKLNVTVYLDIFPLTVWLIGLAILVAVAVCFAFSSDHSVAQGVALSVRLLLQLGYDLSLRRNSSKAE